MSTYTPDRWQVVLLKNKTESIKKVFAGWYGGYASGDSWKLSSGIIGTNQSYSGLLQTSTSGSGVNAVFTVSRSSSTYVTTVASPGNSYVANDTISVSGSVLGGTAPTNNATITVTAVFGTTRPGGTGSYWNPKHTLPPNTTPNALTTKKTKRKLRSQCS